MRRVRMTVTRAAALLTVPGLCLAMAGPAAAARHHFPVPSCGWASAATVSKAIGEQVRAVKGEWSTQLAPVLTCSYVETQPNLQAPGKPIVTVQYRELQRFTIKGFTYVPRLGSCVARSSCPQPGKSAWMMVDQLDSSSTYAFPYDAGVQLRVEDGLNALIITVLNPQGPLTVSDEPGATQSLARALLPRFRWQ